jgi:hypothetical protein
VSSVSHSSFHLDFLRLASRSNISDRRLTIIILRDPIPIRANWWENSNGQLNNEIIRKERNNSLQNVRNSFPLDRNSSHSSPNESYPSSLREATDLPVSFLNCQPRIFNIWWLRIVIRNMVNLSKMTVSDLAHSSVRGLEFQRTLLSFMNSVRFYDRSQPKLTHPSGRWRSLRSRTGSEENDFGSHVTISFESHHKSLLLQQYGLDHSYNRIICASEPQFPFEKTHEMKTLLTSLAIQFPRLRFCSNDITTHCPSPEKILTLPFTSQSRSAVNRRKKPLHIDDRHPNCTWLVKSTHKSGSHWGNVCLWTSSPQVRQFQDISRWTLQDLDRDRFKISSSRSKSLALITVDSTSGSQKAQNVPFIPVNYLWFDLTQQKALHEV